MSLKQNSELNNDIHNVVEGEESVCYKIPKSHFEWPQQRSLTSRMIPVVTAWCIWLSHVKASHSNITLH